MDFHNFPYFPDSLNGHLGSLYVIVAFSDPWPVERLGDYIQKTRWLTGLMMSAQDTYSGPPSINRSAYVGFKTHPVVDVATTYCYPSCKQIYLS